MSLASQILNVKDDNTCTHAEGPFEYWGKSSKYQLIRCKSCNVVLFIAPEKLRNLDNLEPSETDAGQYTPDEDFADIYSCNDESEKLQDLNTYNFDPDDKILILEHDEKPFSLSMLNKNS